MTLLKEWRKWDPDNFPYVLNMDSEDLGSLRWKTSVAKYRSWRKATRDPAFGKSNDKRLHLGLIPVPFMGDMLNASIYVLMLNPGFEPGNYFEHKVPSLQRALIANLRQKSIPGVLPFVFLNPQFAWHGGFGYWDGKLKGVMEGLAESKGMSLADARSLLGRELAVVQLVPYHSVGFNQKAILQLPSVGLAKEFVRRKVVERVRARKAIVIVTRQVRIWNQCLPDDLREKHGIVRYTSGARAASLSLKTSGGRAILRKLGVSADS